MTFQLSGRISIDGKTARSELDQTAAATTKVKAATASLGQEGREAAADLAALKGEVTAYKAQIEALTAAQLQSTNRMEAMAAEHRAAIAALQNGMGGVGRSSQVAAGQVGNLTAQFNDIGMMLVAGQNPLQLAIQQGTQITQVIGPMGAGGAVRALSGAFMGMLNPVSLITMGAIAAGAATVQWLTSAGEEVATLEEALETLTEGVEGYAAASERARSSAADLTDSFGSQATAVRGLLKDMAELERREAERDARLAAANARSDVMDNRWLTLDFSDQATTAKFFELDTQVAGVWDRVNTLIGGFNRLRDAATLEEQIGAATALTAQFLEAAAASGSITKEEDEALRALLGMTEQLHLFQAEQTQAALASSGLADVMDRLQGLLTDASNTNLSHIFTEANGPAQALLGQVERLGTRLSAMAREAADMAAEAAIPPANTPEIEGKGAYAPGNIEFGNPFGGPSAAPSTSPRPRAAPTGVDFGLPPLPPRGGGGGASEVEKQHRALLELIAAEQDHLAILREADPVQKEMLRNREALVGATDAERQELEALITARLAEQEAAKQAKEVSQAFGGAIYDSLDGLILKGQSASDVLDNLIGKLAEAALQALVLGTGPMAGIFGLEGGIVGALLPGKATGGVIYGPGSGTSDDVLMWGSNGEFVVNAAATARNRHLLEAINAGASLPGFAQGGTIGGAGSGGAPAGGRGELAIYMDLRGVQGTEEIEARVTKAIERALDAHDRQVLPGQIKRHIRNERRVG